MPGNRKTPFSRVLVAALALVALAALPARADKKEEHRAPQQQQQHAAPARPAPQPQQRPAPQPQQEHAQPQQQRLMPQPQRQEAPQQPRFNQPPARVEHLQQPQREFNNQPQRDFNQQRPTQQQPQQRNEFNEHAQQPQRNESNPHAQQPVQPMQQPHNNFERAQPGQPGPMGQPAQQNHGFGNNERPGQMAPGARPNQPNRPAMQPAYSLPQNHPAMQPGAHPQPLNQQEGHQVLQQVNGARANMHGVNARPLPQGNVSVAAGGGLRIESGNRNYNVRPNGTMASFSTPQHSARFRQDGTVAAIHTSSGINISRNRGGGRVIVRERPNGVVVVSNGAHYGYVQRRVVYGDRQYVTRTYVANGVVYTRAYHPYYYGGVVMNRYEPTYYYRPAYYRWAYTPWQRPVVYSWGWRRDPWYGYYESYYTPAEYYPSPAYWLGDYLIAAELRESYDARVSSNAYARGQADGYAAAQANSGYGDNSDYGQDYQGQAAPASSPITPEVRAAIAEEVQRQLAEEGRAAQTDADVAPPPGPAAYDQQQAQPRPPDQETPIFLQTPGRVFVVSSNLDVAVDQDSCSLSAGDVLRLDAVPPQGEVSAQVRVLSSKGQDCSAGSVATLSVDDLQEMYNNLHAKIDQGLGELKTAQGNGGMPAAPTIATTPGPGAAVPPPQDDAAAQLAQTQRDADAAEAELDQEMRNNNAAPLPN
jgi:hypothetical protein